MEINEIIDWHTLGNTLGTDHIPEVILGLLGTTMLFVMVYYLKNKDGFVYKFLVLFGLMIGIIATAFCVGHPTEVTEGTLIIIAIGGFLLTIRPFRNVHLALIIAIFGMIVLYTALADMHEPIDFFNNKWWTIITSLAVGLIIYIVLRLFQEIVFGLAKFLNAWPILMIIGVICMLEAICLYMGYNSMLNSIVS